MKKYIVRLTDDERKRLQELICDRKTSAYRAMHSQILLKVDANGWARSDEETAAVFGCHTNTVRNVRQRFVESGLRAALERKRSDHPARVRKLDDQGEARLVAICHSPPPQGRSRWTFRTLAAELVAQHVVDSISDQTVRRNLKKAKCSVRR